MYESEERGLYIESPFFYEFGNIRSLLPSCVVFLDIILRLKLKINV